MAIVSLFDHTAQRFASGFNSSSDTYKLALYTALTPDLSATTLAAITKTEATGDGYTAGGFSLTSKVISQVTTNDAMFDAADVSWTVPNPGTLSAAYAILYNDTDSGDPPVLQIDFEGTETRTNGQIFQVIWDADGIVKFTVA